MSTSLTRGVTWEADRRDRLIPSVTQVTLSLTSLLAREFVSLQELHLSGTLRAGLAVVRVIRAARNARIVALKGGRQTCFNRCNGVPERVIERDLNDHVQAFVKVRWRIDSLEDKGDLANVVTVAHMVEASTILQNMVSAIVTLVLDDLVAINVAVVIVSIHDINLLWCLDLDCCS